jgi:hypothetical protein
MILLFRFSIELDKSRELEISIFWRDWRSLCAIKFLRLEEFIDDDRHGMALQLEPQGLLFAEVSQFTITITCWPIFLACDSSRNFVCNLKYVSPAFSDQVLESDDFAEAAPAAAEEDFQGSGQELVEALADEHQRGDLGTSAQEIFVAHSSPTAATAVRRTPPV